MQLSESLLKENRVKIAEVPSSAVFELPERVLQFGTGVLLRGLPDYFIDKANKQGLFNGRVLVVKSTDNGDTAAFEDQNNLFTLCVGGIMDGEHVEEYIVNAAISRVVSARNQWDELLQAAGNPDMKIVISNTTEVGITLMEDNIHAHPPMSFPGKLLAFLYRRYKIFHGDPERGMVIVPTELIPENGTKLEAIVTELAHQNRLDAPFIDWLEQSNDFCNSLVDRIVPGKLPATEQEAVQKKLGYTDELMIMAEPYRLWVIETRNERVRNALSFAPVDAGIVLTPDIHLYRELKVRLLNGPHTFTCGLAVLAGFTTVKEAMDNALFADCIKRLMLGEITPAITEGELTYSKGAHFSAQVLDRFRNPNIDHRWLSISMNYSSKMKMRNIPAVLKHYDKTQIVPEAMALGFAAFLLFMRCRIAEDGRYYGYVNGMGYMVQDDNAGRYAELWDTLETRGLVRTVLQDVTAWDTDLTRLPGFEEAVGRYLDQLLQEGAAAVMAKLLKKPVVAVVPVHEL